jgi:hypothetical protein
VGFLEYACSTFLEKDWIKTKLLVSPKARFPQFFRDDFGFVCIFPEPTAKISEEDKTISLMGYAFPAGIEGQAQLVRLFGASVLHFRCHALSSQFQDYEEWKKGKDLQLVKFVASLLEDVKANAYCAMQYPDKLADLAFANALGLKRLRRLDRLLNPATKTMAGLLVRSNTGLDAINAGYENNLVNHLVELLNEFEKKAIPSLTDENLALREEKLKIANQIYYAIKDSGPITEAPFFPHTEELGACSIFLPSYFVDPNVAIDKDFKKCLEYLGRTLGSSEGASEANPRMTELDAVQVFDSWARQKEKDKKIIERYQTYLPSTGFKSIEIPEQDYTEFLRIRARCKSEAHRLIESLLVARDAVDEDPRKNYGVLDLQEVIQVIASKSPRLDVFMLDENLSKSYSWIILLDASRSMKYLGDFALEIFLILGDIANELLLDPTSWAMYAFNDRLSIIKDPKERYNIRVKSRIGGIKFEGSTMLYDALMIGGQVIKARAENMRLITVISDGYPFGYLNESGTLEELIRTLEGRSISLIGIGTKSRRMKTLFRTSCSVYTLRDLAKKFSNLYLSASQVVAES